MGAERTAWAGTGGSLWEEELKGPAGVLSRDKAGWQAMRNSPAAAGVDQLSPEMLKGRDVRRNACVWSQPHHNDLRSLILDKVLSHRSKMGVRPAFAGAGGLGFSDSSRCVVVPQCPGVSRRAAHAGTSNSPFPFVSETTLFSTVGLKVDEHISFLPSQPSASDEIVNKDSKRKGALDLSSARVR
jgi:hypothetical protein